MTIKSGISHQIDLFAICSRSARNKAGCLNKQCKTTSLNTIGDVPMSSVFKFLLLLIIAIFSIATVWTINLFRKQRHYVKDTGLNNTTQKHRIVANPILIAYVLFPIAVVIGAAILMFYF
jgi:hypothetical protein